MKRFLLSVWQSFKNAPALAQMLIIGAIFVLIVFISGAGAGVHGYFKNRAYEKREAARMKIVQDALIKAEAAKKRAESLEQSALEDKARIEQKQKQTEKGDSINAENKEKRENEINQFQQTESAKINDDNVDLCHRCRDICERAARISANAATDPNAARIQCANNQCAEVCLSE
jgi:competence protein ComGC